MRGGGHSRYRSSKHLIMVEEDSLITSSGGGLLERKKNTRLNLRMSIPNSFIQQLLIELCLCAKH